MTRKKNIAIDNDVYESLLDIGSKRDTFSDIIRKCIDAYYDRSDRQLHPQREHQEPVIHSSRYEAAKAPTQQPSPEVIEINLPGIEFPANRNEIINLAEKANQSYKSNHVKHISEGKYNKLQLKHELGRISKGIEWIINTEPLRREQYKDKEKKLEQERQITK